MDKVRPWLNIGYFIKYNETFELYTNPQKKAKSFGSFYLFILDPIPRTFSQKRRYYDSSTGTTATICSVMLLAVCTCAVQAQFQTVRADIVVYFPRGFIGPESSVFFNSLYRNKLEKNGADLGITVYGTSCVLYATTYYNPSTIVTITTTTTNNNNNKERKKIRQETA